MATLKSVGGNIVKNLVDGTFESGWTSNGTTDVNFTNGIGTVVITKQYNGIRCGNLNLIVGHKYYISTFVLNKTNGVCFTQIQGFSGYEKVGIYNAFVRSSSCIEVTTIPPVPALLVISQGNSGTLYATKPLLIDLTEMFGAGKEPSKEECDKLFGTMDALPQGLSIANPSIFKSTGWNQFNPDMVLEGKAIVNNAIVDGDKTLVVIPCLPCKIGVGENNGYHIHGDGVDENTKVYFTPLNPKEITGELYMHELALSEIGTYVPLIKGYMIVEVPTTANLCAHFLWSEDCDKNAYESYYESVVELPKIPEMSEYGLAGIQSSGTLVCDEIDFERGVYVKRIGSVDIGSLNLIYNGDKATDSSAYIDKNFLIKPSSSYILSNYSNITSIFVRNDGKVEFISSILNNQAAFKDAMQGVMLYYELADPEEYPLPKVNNNYTSSDYGVEQFDGGIPCNANNLYYMRSLAGEIRNFLDRLMAGLGTTDATALADRILAVVNPTVEPTNFEPEIPIEE